MKRPASLVLFSIGFILCSFVETTECAYIQSGRSWMNGFVFADSDITGLSGATVELKGDQKSDRLRAVKLTTKTEQDGKYSMKDIPYGEYSFRVSAVGYDPYQIVLYIGSDMLTQIHVRLKKK